MPKPGFATITIRENVKRRLEEYASRKGYATLGDAILSLLEAAEAYEKLLDTVVARLERLEQLVAAQGSGQAQQQQSVPENRQEETGKVGGGGRKRRATIRDVLSRVKIQFLSEVNPRNPEAFLQKARREGILVFELEDDTVLVDPEWFGEFMEKVNGLGESDPQKLAERLDDRERRLFELLWTNGFLPEYAGVVPHIRLIVPPLGSGSHPRTAGAIRAPREPWKPLIRVSPRSARFHAATTSLVVATAFDNTTQR